MRRRPSPPDAPPLALSRRRALRGMLIAPAALGAGPLVGCGTTGTSAASSDGAEAGRDASPGSDGGLPLTPPCADGAAPTRSQTEGPYFKPKSPDRSSLVEPGSGGARLVLEGIVVTARCRPLGQALVDLWHCDADGVYDNVGFRLRGHQLSDADGRVRFETIVPGLYPGRTRHFHVKVQAPGGPLLTTQLYFPEEPANRDDGLFDPRLLLDVAGGLARFTFVLPG